MRSLNPTRNLMAVLFIGASLMTALPPDSFGSQAMAGEPKTTLGHPPMESESPAGKLSEQTPSVLRSSGSMASVAGNQYVPIGTGTSVSYNDIPFEIHGVNLFARHWEDEFVPVDNIDLSDYTANRIHIIEHAGWATNVPNGVVVGNINVFYEDGTSDSIDLVVGVNIAEWAYDRPENQCCLAHAKVPPAYSFWTSLDSDYYYWGHLFYVSIDTEDKPLDYLELVLDPTSYTGQPSCPESCEFGTPADWFGIGISAITIEVRVPVLLVHGYFSSAGMWGDGPLDFEQALVDEGFLVKPIDLVPKPTNDSIWNYGQRLSKTIADMRNPPLNANQVDIVAHSLGGLAARAYALQNPSRHDVRTLIMLGTPNNGSGLLTRYWHFLRPVLISRFFLSPDVLLGEAGDQMTPGSPFLKRLNGAGLQPSIENYYTIAGNKPIPVLSWLLSGPDDGVVEVASVRAIAGATNHSYYVNHFEYNNDFDVFNAVVNILRGTILGSTPSAQAQHNAYNYQESALIEDSVETGEENDHLVPIDSTISEVRFILGSSGDELDFTLTSPGGTLITPTVAASDPLITYTNAITTLIGYDVISPEQGNWTAHVAVSGTASGEVGYAMLALLDSGLGLSILLDENVYDINDPVPLTAQLVNASGPVTGATVAAQVESPDGGTQTIPLYDDSSHGDAQPNDGIYSNLYTNTFASGAYEVTVTASGAMDDEQFVRETATTIWAEQSIHSSCIVTTTTDSGSGLLRDCIQNVSAGDTITFDPAVFPPGSPATISLTSGQLPDLDDGNVTIDASNAGVVLEGSALTSSQGIVIDSDQNVIKGLEVVNFPASGIMVCCGSRFNVIGGTAPGEGNVVGGNALNGIVIWNAGTNNNTVIGNLVGTDASGTVANPNNGTGIVIADEAKFNTIGGDAPGERNVISGNINGIGIWQPGTDNNVVMGNYIGMNATGANLLPNDHGIVISQGAQGNIIGPDNVISGNRGSGVHIDSAGTQGNIVMGNIIGADPTGTVALGNGIVGVWVSAGAQNNVIGGATSGEGNIISGNGSVGVTIWDSGTMSNTVSSNYIGTDASGTAALPNGDDGVRIGHGATYNTIGGDRSGEGNLISGNGGNGVNISGEDTLYNTITQNSIHSNDGRGIELTDGGNTELPAPVITNIYLKAGTVTGTACASCTVEIFSDDDDQARVYQGSTTAEANGNWSFTIDSPLIGPYITATATDPQGNTSELSTIPFRRPATCPDFVDPPGVGVEDVMLAASHWRCRKGDYCYDERYDLDKDDDIDIIDIMKVVAKWGESCQGQVWFGPNLGSPDFLDLFTQPENWSNARNLVDVLKFYELCIVSDDHPDCDNNTIQRFIDNQAFSLLNDWGIDIALESGAVKHWACQQNPDEPYQVTAGITIQAINNVHGNDGIVKHIAMDEPYIGGEQVINGETCGYDVQQSAAATAQYILLVKEAHPSVIIGDIEPYPYFSITELQEWIGTLESYGVVLPFFQLDVDMAAVEAWNADVENDLGELRAFLEDRDIEFGVILTANHWLAQTDQEYFGDTMTFVNIVSNAIDIPPQVVFQSWYLDADGQKIMPINLPEDNPDIYSHTRLINEGWAAMSGR